MNRVNNRTRRWLPWLLVLGLALLARLACWWLAPAGLAADPDGYRALAENVNEFGVFGTGTQPTAYRPPLYPLLLSAVLRLPLKASIAIGMLHLAFGLTTVYIVARLAQQLHLGRGAWAAAIVAALDPSLLHHTTQVMSETLATCCGALCLACLARASRLSSLSAMAIAGAMLGVSSLCRPNFLAWGILAVAYLAWAAARKQEGWPRAVALAGACGLALVPWALRNYGQLDRPIFTTTHGGYTILLGNNGSFYSYLSEFRWGEAWDPAGTLPARSSVQSELDYDQMCYQQAWQSMREAPGMAVWSALVKMGRLWGLLPHRQQVNESRVLRSARYATAVWYAMVFALALAGAWSQRVSIFAPSWSWVLLMCLAWTAVHAIYWSNLRMRTPLVPGIALLAAAGLNSVLRGLRPLR